MINLLSRMMFVLFQYFQEKFLKLKYDLSAQDLYKQSTLDKLWSTMCASHPHLPLYAVRFPLPFASTNFCESGFSPQLTIKSTLRNSQEAIVSDLRCASPKTTTNFVKLVSEMCI